MTEFPAGVQRRVVLRSFLVQGSWNYETLIGTGFAFTILPVLRHIYGSDPERLRAALVRHSEVFNSHPYLVTVAAGAIARLEADGVDPQIVQRFKSALRGSLGSIGDQLVWNAGRPAAVLLGLVLLLAGAAWWVGVLVFLVVYNALHLALRVWGWRVGTASGLEVARILREAPLQHLARRAADVGAVLGGLALALTAAPALGDPLATAVNAGAVVAGISLGLRARPVFVAAIGVAWLLAIASGLIR